MPGRTRRMELCPEPGITGKNGAGVLRRGWLSVLRLGIGVSRSEPFTGDRFASLAWISVHPNSREARKEWR